MSLKPSTQALPSDPALAISPWQTISSEEVYANPWIAVRHEQVINPSGGQGIYGVVHFKNMAIGIVVLDSDGYTYLVGQYRYTLNEYCWEIPEGGGPHGISALESAKRELQEETGLLAATWTDLGRIHTSNSVTDEFGYLFLAEDITPGPSSPEETEELAVARLPFAEAVAMAMDGRISDSLSIAGLLKVALLRGVQ